MHIGLKIKKIAEEKKITIDKIADHLGKTKQAVYDLLKKEHVNSKILISLSILFNVDIKTFFDGSSFDKQSEPKAPTPIGDDTIELPFIAVSARATFAETLCDYPKDSVETMQIIKFPDIDYTGKLIIEIDGDSMEPTLHSGSKVLISPINQQNWHFINSGVYVVSYSNFVCVKRIIDNNLVDKGFLKLHSDNKNGGSYIVKGEDIRAIYKVERIVDGKVH